jgi:Calcineurin-like phosphoesterase
MVRPAPAPTSVLRRFTRGRERPRGVVWFGARSLWGHLRHLIAAAIATQNIDSRTWMTPDEPDELLARIARELGGDTGAPTLTGALGRDLYVDFVADTGDDVSVSRAVATMLFAPYELPDPEHPDQLVQAPRGDILVFGGDTAYPVATVRELANRVVGPWNQVLADLPPDPTPRVVLAVPGNHDWYDGLDGFARLFRRRPAGGQTEPRQEAMAQPRLQRHFEWVRRFAHNRAVPKPAALALSGYAPVQGGSYFALALAPGIEALAVDRQLTSPDEPQAQFLRGHHGAAPGSALLLLLPDPVFAFGVPTPTGTDMLAHLQLDDQMRTFVLTGDIHHYERLEHGPLLQVTAGGGGAFLHPTRIARGGLTPAVAWPNRGQCRAILRQVPWTVARGRAGLLPHAGLTALYGLALLLTHQLKAHIGMAVSVWLAATLLTATVYALIGGVTRAWSVAPLALGAGALTALIAGGGAAAVYAAFDRVGWSAPTAVAGLLAWAVAVMGGALVFGGFLAILTRLGHEHLQAFTTLDHPGFKHFVRLRIRADGRGIDGWCIGAADPIAGARAPVLVDSFTWRPHPERE